MTEPTSPTPLDRYMALGAVVAAISESAGQPAHWVNYETGGGVAAAGWILDDFGDLGGMLSAVLGETVAESEITWYPFGPPVGWHLGEGRPMTENEDATAQAAARAAMEAANRDFLG